MNLKYVLRRLGIFFLIIWVASTLNFIIPRLAPGDPMSAILGKMQAQGTQVANSAQIIEMFRERFHWVSHFMFSMANTSGRCCILDLGYSIAYFPAKVTDIVQNALPYTIGLLTITTLITFVLGVFAGALLVWHTTPRAAKIVITFFMMLAPIPYYLLANVFSGASFRLAFFPIVVWFL